MATVASPASLSSASISSFMSSWGIHSGPRNPSGNQSTASPWSQTGSAMFRDGHVISVGPRREGNSQDLSGFMGKGVQGHTLCSAHSGMLAGWGRGEREEVVM